MYIPEMPISYPKMRPPVEAMTQVKTTPILARRLTQRGMRARATRRRHAASQKWLQLRETRL